MTVVPVDQPTISSAEMLQRYPQLQRAGNELYVPPLVAMGLKGNRRTVSVLRDIPVTSGGRTCTTGNEAVFDLKDLGYTTESVRQVFRENRKGVGTRIGGSKSVKKHGAEAYRTFREAAKKATPFPVRMLGNYLYSDKRLDGMNVITRESYEFERPEGGQRNSFAIGTVQTTDRILRDLPGIKICPVVHAYQMPEEIEAAIQELTVCNGVPPSIAIGQECRYVPSDIRAVNIIPDHVRIGNFKTMSYQDNPITPFSENPDELRQILERFYHDVPPYLGIYTHYFKGKGGTFTIPRVGDIDLAYNDRENMKFRFGVTSDFTSKDVVVAPTGLYFADLESINLAEPCPEGEFPERFNLYVTNVLRDFTTMLYNFRLGVHLVEGIAAGNSDSWYYGIPSQPRRQMKEEVTDKLVDAIERRPNLRARRSGDGIEVSVATNDGWLTTNVGYGQIYKRIHILND